jgi:hypothetical protein
VGYDQKIKKRGGRLRERERVGPGRGLGFQNLPFFSKKIPMFLNIPI